MATQISSDAQKVLEGASQEARDYAMANAPGDKLTSGEASRLLASFNAGDVMSANNVASTISSPATLDLSDLLGVRERLMDELGYTTARTEANTAIQAIRDFDVQAAEQQQAIEGRVVPLEVLRGEQAEAARTASLERTSLSTAAQAKTDLLSALGSELNTRFGIYENLRNELTSLMVNNPGAGITYTDTIESASRKLDEYNKSVAKKEAEEAKEAEEKAYKRSLQAVAMELGISTKTSKGGTKNTDKLEKEIAAVNKEALDYARAKASSTGKSEDAGASATKDAMAYKEAMRRGYTNWSTAWSEMAMKYGFNPNNSDDIKKLDILLGVNEGYRSQYDISLSELGQLSEPDKKSSDNSMPTSITSFIEQ